MSLAAIHMNNVFVFVSVLMMCGTCRHSDSGYTGLIVSLCRQTTERTLPTVPIEVPELVVEEEVENWIDTRVGSAQPLGDRRASGQQVSGEAVLVESRPQLDHGKDDVEGQPGQGEQQHNDDQHFEHFNLRAFDHMRRLLVTVFESRRQMSRQFRQFSTTDLK